ncbi:MAG: radical SAM protein, partial [Verrucomicrobiota bacterium]
MYPTYASLAVTLHCNARCVHCDIWKNKFAEEAPASMYEKLPSSLRTIDITGGEPFLRNDLPEVVGTIKKSCPDANLLITTHGFFHARIERLLPEIRAIDPDIAFRISLDGMEETHNRVRGLPNFFGRAMKSIDALQKGGVKNLGVIFSMMHENRAKNVMPF